MKEFLGQSGNIFYIINQDFDEACSFDVLGNEVESDLQVGRAVTSCSSVSPIDVVSILGTSGIIVGEDYTEVYFNGYSASVNKPHIQVFSAIRKGIRSIGGRYYLRRREGYSQIIMAVKKGTVTKDFLADLIGTKLHWKKLG